MEKRKKSPQIPVLSDNLLMQIIHVALKNAYALVQDADLLYSNARYPRAAALYQLAMEETGKALLAQNYLFLYYKDYSTHIEKFNKSFFNHVPKSQRSTAVDFMLAEMIYAGKPEKMKEFISKREGRLLNRTVQEMDEMRNNCFYAGYFNGSVVDPADFIKEKSASVMRDIAKMRYNMAKAMTTMSIKHLTETREEFEKTPSTEDDVVEELRRKYGL